MKIFINIINSLLLSIAIFICVISFTLLNKYYLIHEYEKYNYYQVSIDYITEHIDNVEIDINKLKKDINDYIKNYFKDKNYSSELDRDIYNQAIRRIGPYNDLRLYRDLFDLFAIVFVIITGIVLNKCKKKHNINVIFILSGITGIIVSFIIYINIKYDYMINNILIDYYKMYLGVNILLLIYPLYKYVYSKIVKR